MSIYRIYVEKKEEFAVEAKRLLEDVRIHLKSEHIENIRILHRYDVENIQEELYEKVIKSVFHEAPVDKYYKEDFPRKEGECFFALEYLPGQYDQRADSAKQCIRILDASSEVKISVAKIIVLEGEISKKEIEEIKKYCINPVDSREASIEKKETLQVSYEIPDEVKILHGFSKKSRKEIEEIHQELALAMTEDDLEHTQQYFAKIEKRNPSITEIRVLDTYWSDHCRHTTFLTKLEKVSFDEKESIRPIKETYERYKKDREAVYGEKVKEKDECLMDIALLAMKKIRAMGKLDDVEVSDEINACSIIVDVDIDGKKEEWLVMFKNETHNHPTEIEPFGGAATCLGGAIRDPLSGRSYVYQAMRVTGAGDPRQEVKDTLEGKLPQRTIVTKSAEGYSSYGNQIGLATGLVREIYHPNYIAKRMEIGAVIAAAPKENVIRETANPGDYIILLGGRTGRDGCGGATGSSKQHTVKSIDTSSAEVQKGNPPTERKIQRLFRREEVAKMIKKCNDFGAGGVSVAIGELADGLVIDLDKVPKKYDGLDGTELAISESQERMAVVIEEKDVPSFLLLVEEENLEGVHVATVTEEKRLIMKWKGKDIVNITRSFLDTNGAGVKVNAHVEAPLDKSYFDQKKEKLTAKNQKLKTAYEDIMSNLNICSQKGLVERFDSSIGAGSVFMPYGGKTENSPMEAMVGKIPVLHGETNTGTIMSYGFNPYLSSWSPYHGAVYAVVESLAKVVAVGGRYDKVRFTFQEYFKRLQKEEKRWGEPLAALLGAYYIQDVLHLPSIGGKDSMSGSFHEMDVPPTLVSFAVDTVDVRKTVSSDIKGENHILLWVDVPRDERELPNIEVLKENYTWVHGQIEKEKVLSAMPVLEGGIGEAVAKMGFGNRIGTVFYENVSIEEVFLPRYGSILLEVESGFETKNLPKYITVIGKTTKEPRIQLQKETMELDKILEIYESPLEDVYPTKVKHKGIKDITKELFAIKKEDRKETKKIYIAKHKIAKPQVFIPVFPGTNCEYDTAKAFQKAGATTKQVVFCNMTSAQIEASIKEMEKAIRESQMIMLPGGFSAGDEPDGSGKFIANVCRNSRLEEAIMELLQKRDGLMLGICNGFQALLKLGLLPYGEICEITEDTPTLSYNTIGRHVSRMVRTKVVSNQSPWLQKVEIGEIHQIPVSHGEGRFVGSEKALDTLFQKGMVATAYVDEKNEPSMDIQYNPNGSMEAIEGIMSLDGRILGKMGHSERIGNNVYKNIYGNKEQSLFVSGVDYFK